VTHDISTLEKLEDTAAKFVEEFPTAGVFLLKGEMGVGKTTFIGKVCRALQVQDEVSSPTFSLVNEYRNQDDEAVFHFDFYRIDDEEEAMDMGVEEYFYSGDFCFVEWPEKIPTLLPEDAVVIEFWFDGDQRKMKWEK
jgi:tRNA threonylcarbamoyladenosine biosynthesis protein TsaE